MLAKLVAWGETREAARWRLLQALRESVLLGVPTNRAFLTSVLDQPRFVAGGADTGFLLHSGVGAGHGASAATLALAAALLFHEGDRYSGPDEWRNWRSTGPAPTPMRLALEDRRWPVNVEPAGARAYVVHVEGASIPVALSKAKAQAPIDVTIDGVRRRVAVAMEDRTLHLGTVDGDWAVRDASHDRTRATRADSDGQVRAPLTGRVAHVAVAGGEEVRRGQLLVLMEAMKMEHRILAPVDGRIVELRAVVGMQASAGTVLLLIAPSHAPEQSRAA
jgi:geranyl-CoA carboxylase alpha subunit